MVCLQGEDNMDEKRFALESQTRMLFHGAVWSHKIQEVEADRLSCQYRILEFITICTSAVTTSGVVGALFINNRIVQILTAICSVLSLFSSIYCKNVDFKQRAKEHKITALRFLDVREKFVVLLRKLRFSDVPTDDLEKEFEELLCQYNSASETMGETSPQAARIADKAFKKNRDYSYNDAKIDVFLSPELRRQGVYTQATVEAGNRGGEE